MLISSSSNTCPKIPLFSPMLIQAAKVCSETGDWGEGERIRKGEYFLSIPRYKVEGGRSSQLGGGGGKSKKKKVFPSHMSSFFNLKLKEEGGGQYAFSFLPSPPLFSHLLTFFRQKKSRG